MAQTFSCLHYMAAHGLYIHAVPGRLRIDLPALQHDQSLAERVTHALRSLAGIRKVSCSHVTGRALIEFDNDVLDHERVIEALENLDCFPTSCAHERGGGLKQFAANTLLDVASDLVLKNGLMWALGLP